MNTQTLSFHSNSFTDYHFEFTQDDLSRLAPPANTVVITDDNVLNVYGELLAPYRVLSFPAGEAQKNLDTLARLTEDLISKGAHRKTMLIGFGGGVVTDMVGFLAATFMRGLPVGFVPTTLLAQVDAAVGGKNGVNSGLHKNMLGTFRQPDFIAFDPSYLNSLPDAEWSNGMAEVIKYGFIADKRILNAISTNNLGWIQKHPQKLNELIEGCVNIKNKIVHADEKEEGLRQVLNFGHTAGHAFETLYKLPHGHAVGLGMRVAMRLSEQHCGLDPAAGEQLRSLLELYKLPVRIEHNADQVMDLLSTDKKRGDKGICFVLIEKPGVAVTRWLKPEEIHGALETCS
jgi:3-dehydroquinate synthase